MPLIDEVFRRSAGEGVMYRWSMAMAVDSSTLNICTLLGGCP